MDTTTDCVLVLTTLPAGHDAAELAQRLVTARVAACVTITPSVESIYAWQGSIERSQEQQLVIKTTRARVADLWARLKEEHPYDVPEFVVMPIVDGNPAYLDWIREETRRG